MTQIPMGGLPSDPAGRRIDEAQKLLRHLNFDDERCNERSALVLLALLALSPTQAWGTVERPCLRTVEIMVEAGASVGVAQGSGHCVLGEFLVGTGLHPNPYQEPLLTPQPAPQPPPDPTNPQLSPHHPLSLRCWV